MKPCFSKRKELPQGSITALLVVSSFIFSTCALKKTGDTKNKQPPWNPGQNNAAAFDFSKHCGLDDNLPDDAVVFSQNLKSLNFVVEAGMAAFKARVEAEASLAISGKTNGGTQKIDVKVNKVTDLSNNPTAMKTLITKIGARIVAGSRGGTITAKALPFKDWLRLVDGGNPEFKGLLCAVTGDASSQKEEEKGKLYEFSPALAASINPRASVEQREKEIGNGRRMSVKATLTNPISKQVVSTTSGFVQIKPFNPQLRATDPLTKRVVNIQADSAYQVISDFSAGKADFQDYNSKITFYLDHKNKKFLAITQEELPSASDKEMKMPMIVMLPE